MKFTDRLHRFFAPDDVHRQLYPAPQIKFSIRKYCPHDRDTVLEIYDSNAPGRFPEGHRSHFEDFLSECDNALFVAENPEYGVIGCGGVHSTGSKSHTLCYGMVSPDFQGMRVGSTLTLARLVFASQSEGLNFSFIYSLDKSIPFYQRFGYQEFQKWQDDHQKNHPAGVLYYHSRMMRSIERTLSKRGHTIDGSMPLTRCLKVEAKINELPSGQFTIEFVPRFPPN